MKRLIILSFLVTHIIFELSAQDCSPTLKEIYDIKPGSIFQYKYKVETFGIGDNENSSTRIDKYQIIEKNVLNDSIMLVRQGLSTGFSIVPPFADTSNIFTREIFDTLWLVDSSSHFLNACDSELVYLGLENNFYSRVILEENSGKHSKRVGGYIDGRNNLLKYNENDSLIEVITHEYEQIFIEGVGLSMESYFVFEWVETYDLQGYVINEDTTGIIWEDEDFITSIKNSIKTEAVEIYPSILAEQNVITIISSSKINDLHIYSLNGVEIQFEWLNDKQISMKNLSKGIYVLVFDFNYQKILREIVKN